MKVLVLGAGATGGYYGGRLAAAGVDVTFLVRPRRAEQLARDGLKIETSSGAIQSPARAITSDEAAQDCDVILLTAKAYDLNSAIDAIRPAVGPKTQVLPLLNGMRHLDDLDAAFGADRVLGGACHISATLSPDGTIKRFSDFDALTQGPRSPAQGDFCQRLHATLNRGGFEARLSADVIGAMWEKWVLLATLAGSTCLMRATIGEIVATDEGAKPLSTMIDECSAIAVACGNPPRPGVVDVIRAVLTDPQSTMGSSMLRDIERGSRTEARHILGDLIARGAAVGVDAPLLRLAFAHMQAYDARLDAAAQKS